MKRPGRKPNPNLEADASKFGLTLICQGRKRLKMSQLQFGELTGVPVAAVRQWEMGRRYPTQPTRKFFELLSLHHGLKFDAKRRY